MQAQKMVAAETMARAVQFDPQFVAPVRPRFPRELVLIPLAEGLLVEGTDEQQLLRGQATKTLLPRLLPLLDGTRTIAQLATELNDVAPGHIQQAIALLYTRGLLEDAAADPVMEAQQIDPHLLAFFRRHVDTTRVNRSALQAAERLQNSAVVVYGVGHETQRGQLAEQLRSAGIGSVTEAELGSALQFPTRYKHQLVVVLVVGDDDEAALTQLDEQCAQLGVAWLRVAVTNEAADLGPYFERGETACYRCFRIADAHKPASSAVTALQTKLWAAMLATEVIYLLSRIAPLATGVYVKRYDLQDWSAQALRFPRLPGCPNCRPVAGMEAGPINAAIVFEDAVRFPSRHLNDPKGHQVHYRVSNLDLAKDSKRYPNAAKVSLPAQEQLIQVPGSVLQHLPQAEPRKDAVAALHLESLASLLLLSGGIWHDDGPDAVKTVKPKRWAATGGNLGSVELYVAAYNVAGLAPGLYFYEVREHQLAQLSSLWTPEDAAQFIAQATGSSNCPDALILSVGATHRVASKYGAFAYRVINLDAGVALAQLQMVASSLGHSTRLAERWADDVIAEQLNLHDLSEAVTGAVYINGVRSAQGETEQ